MKTSLWITALSIAFASQLEAQIIRDGATTSAGDAQILKCSFKDGVSEDFKPVISRMDRRKILSVSPMTLKTASGDTFEITANDITAEGKLKSISLRLKDNTVITSELNDAGEFAEINNLVVGTNLQKCGISTVAEEAKLTLEHPALMAAKPKTERPFETKMSPGSINVPSEITKASELNRGRSARAAGEPLPGYKRNLSDKELNDLLPTEFQQSSNPRATRSAPATGRQ